MKCSIVSVSTVNQWSMDFTGNEERIKESIRQSKIDHNAKIRIGPELEISGYTCEDHFFEPDTIYHSWKVLASLLDFTSRSPYNDMLCMFGMAISLAGLIYNCSIYTYNGKLIMIKPKLILADDGNYRESRWFTPWEMTARILKVQVPACITEATGQTEVLFGNFILRTSDGYLIGTETCEELWAPICTSTALLTQGIHLIINGSGSHYRAGNQQKRESLVRDITIKHGGVYLYSNFRGCDGTRLYFDGGSMIYENGVQLVISEGYVIKEVDVVSACVDLAKIELYRAHSHTQEVSKNSIVSLEMPIIDIPDFCLVMKNAVVSVPGELTFSRKEKVLSFGPACWLWDYLRRSKARGLFLPLSGGADSGSTLAFVGIMCEIIIKSLSQSGYNKNIIEQDLLRIIGSIPQTSKELAGKLMYTAYLSTANSSSTTRNLASLLAGQIGSRHYEVNMDKIVASFKKMFLLMSGSPEPKYQGQGGTWAEDIALQNIQARSRMVMSYMLGQLLPASFKQPGQLLVLASGNLEEGLTGYMTKYDCSSADINLIGGISKVDLFQFMDWASEEFGYTALKDIASAPPTAELKPLEEGKTSQTDEEDLGLTYKEMADLGRLRKIGKLGPFMTFRNALNQWPHLKTSEIATKVKRFYTLHGRNRHKMSVVTPSIHYEGYSADDNRFDMRQMIYNYAWPFQFQKIDELSELIR